MPLPPEERDRLMEEGRAAFNRGEFYEAHEHWEEIWMEAEDPEWTWLQGLIQVATSYHKVSRGYGESAQELLRRALGRLEDAPDVLWGTNVARARASAQSLLDALTAGQPPPTAPKL